MKPEAEASRAIQRDLKTMGFAVWSTEQGYRKERGGTRTTAGFPDLVALGHGVVLFIEVKAPGKAKDSSLSDAQKLFRHECQQNGQHYILADDSVVVFDYLVEIGVFETVH